MTEKQTKNTYIINLFGAPGSGKSTSSALLFGKLKQMDIDCELVTEYAKDLVWEQRSLEFTDQLCIIGKQLKRLLRCNGKVDFIITDSPIYLSSYYNIFYNRVNFNKICKEAHNKFNNINIFLNRTKKYNPNGRYQTEKESDIVGQELKILLDSNNIKYLELDGDKNCVNNIIKYLKENKYLGE